MLNCRECNNFNEVQNYLCDKHKMAIENLKMAFAQVELASILTDHIIDKYKQDLSYHPAFKELKSHWEHYKITCNTMGSTGT